MAKVLLLAYTNTNFGDDMFIKTICEYFPNVQFEIEAPMIYKKSFQTVPNIKIIKKNRMLDYSNALKRKLRIKESNIVSKYDAVVYIVGALFDEDSIWYETIEKNGLDKTKRNLWKNAFSRDVPFFLLGCNMTRVKSEVYIEQMKYMFDGINDICFRDKYSYDFFKEMHNTRFAPDIVFNYNPLLNVKEKIAIISVWGVLVRTDKYRQWKWAEAWWSDYCNYLVLASNYLRKAGYKIVLLSLCEDEGDFEACQIVNSQLEVSAQIINYTGDMDNIIQLFEKGQFVIGTRFHSIVMAINCKCNFFPIIYESKTEQMLKDINYCGPLSKIDDIKNHDVTDLIKAYQNPNTIDLCKIKDRAKDQFKNLKIVLESV